MERVKYNLQILDKLIYIKLFIEISKMKHYTKNKNKIKEKEKWLILLKF
jgi:hypothetical protein